MKKILITGVNSFLGKHLLNKLLDNNIFSDIEKIVGIDNFISSRREEEYKKDNKYKFVKTNLIKYDFNLLEKFDLVIHLASLGSPVYYKKFPLKTIDIGSNVTRFLLEKFKEWQAQFIFFSSSEIYGNPSSNNIPTAKDFKGCVSC